jgi:hypothetical protein
MYIDYQITRSQATLMVKLPDMDAMAMLFFIIAEPKSTHTLFLKKIPGAADRNPAKPQ